MTRLPALMSVFLAATLLPAAAQTAPDTGNPNLSVASVKMDNGVRVSRIIASPVYADPSTESAR